MHGPGHARAMPGTRTYHSPVRIPQYHQDTHFPPPLTGPGPSLTGPGPPSRALVLLPHGSWSSLTVLVS